MTNEFVALGKQIEKQNVRREYSVQLASFGRCREVKGQPEEDLTCVTGKKERRENTGNQTLLWLEKLIASDWKLTEKLIGKQRKASK